MDRAWKSFTVSLPPSDPIRLTIRNFHFESPKPPAPDVTLRAMGCMFPSGTLRFPEAFEFYNFYLLFFKWQTSCTVFLPKVKLWPMASHWFSPCRGWSQKYRYLPQKKACVETETGLAKAPENIPNGTFLHQTPSGWIWDTSGSFPLLTSLTLLCVHLSDVLSPLFAAQRWALCTYIGSNKRGKWPCLLRVMQACLSLISATFQGPWTFGTESKKSQVGPLRTYGPSYNWEVSAVPLSQQFFWQLPVVNFN